MTSRNLTHLFLALAALVLLTLSAVADPGLDQNNVNRVSDQKKGSILLYNLYCSSSTNPTTENARLNITNTNDEDGVFVHLFFVDGSSCAVADSYVCLSKSQTVSLLASDTDPDVRGYMVAIATDSDGKPVSFNHLIGDEYVKTASGHVANLAAESVAARFWDADRMIPVLPVVDADMISRIRFDDKMYDALPRVLALDNLASTKDGNDTRLVVNAITGDLRTRMFSVGTLFGLLFDELEAGYSFTTSTPFCQYYVSLSDSAPRTSPRLSNVIPAGSTGWMKFWATTDQALLGAAINKNTTASASAFNSGHNLHKLTFTTSAWFRVPVFPTMCN